jgi:hypothetical protein
VEVLEDRAVPASFTADTVAHVTNDHASTSDNDIYGTYSLIV